MKKGMIFSLLLCVLVCGAFAQLTFNGEAYVGARVDKIFNKDETVDLFHRKKGNPLFNFTASAVRENYGVKLDVDFVGVANNISVNGIYGWAGFMDDALHFSIGQISDSKYISNLDPDDEVFFDQVKGFRVDYKTPIEGLNAGAAFRAEGQLMEDFFKRIILGASYIHPMGNAVVSYDMGNNHRFLFAANYTGMDDLTDAGIEIYGKNLASWESRGYTGELQFREKIGYRIMRPLTVSMLMGQKFFGISDSDVQLFFRPSASYRIMPGLTGFLTLEANTPNYFDTTDFYITPCLEYTLKGTALIYVEYQLKLSEYKRDSYHRFGFGIDIKAF